MGMKDSICNENTGKLTDSKSDQERVVMCCSNCKYWTRLPISDQWLPEDEEGECEGLTIKNVYIELKTGWDGGFVERIETKHDFFCANFE